MAAAVARTAAAVGGLAPDQLQFFRRQGFVLIPKFYSATACAAMRRAAERIVAQYRDAEGTSVFSTVKQRTNDYFLTSGDKIRYFFEQGAVDETGKVVVPRDRAFNKLGHALHTLDHVFYQHTFDPRLQAIARSLGFVDARVPQSMYIFKQPGIGGEVVPHQDSTFLHTSPLTTVGFWTPLQDCARSNGCLWMLPASHLEGLHNGRRMVRRQLSDGLVDTTFTAEPRTYDPRDFIPVEIPAGTLVIIHGEVIHKSDANLSEKSRHAYTFHIIEAHNTEYDKLNWLQYPEGVAFPSLYTPPPPPSFS